MNDFSAARENMVECQLLTTGVRSEAVLEAYAKVPRELFVPDDKQGGCYVDEDIALGDGRFLMEPSVHARLVELCRVRDDDIVLDIGGTTGYSAAVLSYLATTVVALENDNKLADEATKIWRELSVCNAAAEVGDLQKGSPEHQPYSLIFLNGAAAEIPESLLDQLGPDGRLVYIRMQPGEKTGKAILIQRSGKDGFCEHELFDAASPYLPGFAPGPAFVF